MAIVAKKLTFAERAALPPSELFNLGKVIARKNSALEAAQERYHESIPDYAKTVAALKRLHATRKDAHEIPGDTTFKKFFKDNCGGELPGRVEAIASLFNALCLTLDVNGKPLFAEECFDDAKLDWLEKANAIVSDARKTHGDPGWKTCDDVLDTVNAMSKAGDAGKKLKAIRKRQKGEKESDKDSSDAQTAAQPLTIGRAVEFLKAAVKNAGTLPAPEAKAFFYGCTELVDTWNNGASGVSEDTVLKWLDDYQRGIPAHLEITSAASAEALAA